MVAPPTLPAPAGTAVVNGMGELTGKIEIDERGTMETPVYLCGTHAVGIVHHAALLASGHGPEEVILPVVGECDDSWRADSRRVTTGDVDRALGALGTEVAEGSVGAGTGMMCFDFPGGIGTASRAVGEHHVGVLLLCNFGDRERLDLLGTSLDPPDRKVAPAGSCISVCATDAPVDALALRRLALRALLGLVRVGSYGHDGSGEIGLAFSTGAPAALAGRRPRPVLRRRLGGGAGGRLQLPGRRPAGADASTGRCRTPSRSSACASSPAPVSAAASQLRDEVVELARDLIRVDTSNPPGNETPAAELLAAYLRGAGVEQVELVGPDPARLNLVARIPGAGRGPR